VRFDAILEIASALKVQRLNVAHLDWPEFESHVISNVRPGLPSSR
jgi:hypothetical protein